MTAFLVVLAIGAIAAITDLIRADHERHTR